MCESIRVFTVVPTRPSVGRPRSYRGPWFTLITVQLGHPVLVRCRLSWTRFRGIPGHSGARGGRGGRAAAGRPLRCRLSQGERRRLLEFDSRISRRT